MNRVLPPVRVEGIAFWSPRLPGWDIARAVMRGEKAPSEALASRPAPTVLPPNERRRAPDTVAVALEVASKACEAAARAPTDLPSVFASTHGDLPINDYMCSTLAATPTLISPTKFHNSVHNAAAGYWSIGSGSHAPYTALSAFKYTFGAGLLEAATQVACEDRPVLLVAFDVEAKGALSTVTPSRGLLGVALVLAPEKNSDRSGRSLSFSVRSDDSDTEPTASRSATAAVVSENALAPCLPLFEALARDEAATIVLGLSERTVLQVRVQ